MKSCDALHKRLSAAAVGILNIALSPKCFEVEWRVTIFIAAIIYYAMVNCLNDIMAAVKRRPFQTPLTFSSFHTY